MDGRNEVKIWFNALLIKVQKIISYIFAPVCLVATILSPHLKNGIEFFLTSKIFWALLVLARQYHQILRELKQFSHKQTTDERERERVCERMCE